VHAGPLAARTGIARVLVPQLAPVFSALGCCLAEVSVEAIRTHRGSLSEASLAAMAAVAAELAANETARLGEPPGSVTVSRQLELRYLGQNAELAVGWPTEGTASDLAESFRAAHEREYGFATEDPIEVTAIVCRLAVAGAQEWPAAIHAGDAATARSKTTIVGPGGERHEVPVVAVSELSPARRVAGPAILAAPFSSITVWIGQSATVDDDGAVVLEAS
jgi:N-methylhydantoinase A